MHIERARRKSANKPKSSWRRMIRSWLLETQNGECQRCSTTHNLTIDHIVPLSMGGSWHRNNLQLLCRRCNRKKGASIADYRSLQPRPGHTCSIRSEERRVGKEW